MKRNTKLTALVGVAMIFLSAGYYDTLRLTATPVHFGVFVPAIVGTLILTVWLNQTAIRRYVRRVKRNFPIVMEDLRQERAAVRAKAAR